MAIQFRMTLEDTELTATFHQEGDTQVVDVEVTDTFTNTSGKATWTKEWRAVLIIIANDDENLPNMTELYAIAEPAVAMIPPECRPIP